MLDSKKKKSVIDKIAKYCILIIVYQIIVIRISNIRGIGPTNIEGWIIGIISNNYDGHYESLWYLYAYIVFLIILPYLRMIAKNFERRDAILLLFLYCIFNTVVPMIQGVMNWVGSPYYLKLNESFEIPLVTSRIFFWPLIGYYIENKIDINSVTSRHIFVLTIVAIVGIFISDLFCFQDGIRNGFTYRYNSIFCYVTAIWVYLCVKFLVNRFTIKNNWLLCLITKVSSVTFGVYLLDPLLKETGIQRLINSKLFESCSMLEQSVMWCICSIFICGITTLLLKRVPIIREFF